MIQKVEPEKVEPEKVASIPEIITLKQFQAMLAEKKGARIVTLTICVAPDLRKDCPYTNILKISVINGIVNFNYSNSVNNQRGREGKEKDFKAEKRKWGTKLEGLPFVSHVDKEGNHKLYLEIKVERILSTKYIDDEGVLVPEEQVQPYLHKDKSSKEHQGVDKEIIYRNPDVSNIEGISVDGKNYVIRN